MDTIIKFQKQLTNENHKQYNNCVVFPIVNECYSRSQLLGAIAVWDTPKSKEIEDYIILSSFSSELDSIEQKYEVVRLELEKYRYDRGEKIEREIFKKYKLYDIRFMDTIKVVYKEKVKFFDGVYKVNVKVKDNGIKIFHLNQINEEPNALFLELEVSNFHSNSYWSVESDIETFVNGEISSAGGSHNSKLLVGVFPFGIKLTEYVDTYKGRNGSHKVLYQVTPDGLVGYSGQITEEQVEDLL